MSTAIGVEPSHGRWAVIDRDGGTMCCVREKATAQALVGCSFDGARFMRRVAVARAVELRGLAQCVGPEGRRAAARSSMSSFDAGHSAAWAVLSGWRILDWWTPGRSATSSVALAGAMP